MHAVLIISSLLVVTLGGALLLSRLRRVDRWADRRELQIAVLAAPMLSLGIAVVGLRHFTGRICFVSTPERMTRYCTGSSNPSRPDR